MKTTNTPQKQPAQPGCAPAAGSLVAQEDRSGCGIACVAMLAGKTYAQVRSFYLQSGNRDEKEARLSAVGNGAGMTAGELVDLMGAFGVPPHIAKTGPLVYRIEGQPGLGGHFVVITADGTILDPANDQAEPRSNQY